MNGLGTHAVEFQGLEPRVLLSADFQFNARMNTPTYDYPTWGRVYGYGNFDHFTAASKGDVVTIHTPTV